MFVEGHHFRVAGNIELNFSGNTGWMDMRGPLVIALESLNAFDSSKIGNRKAGGGWMYENKELLPGAIYYVSVDGSVNKISNFSEDYFRVEIVTRERDPKYVDNLFSDFELKSQSRLRGKADVIKKLEDAINGELK